MPAGNRDRKHLECHQVSKVLVHVVGRHGGSDARHDPAESRDMRDTRDSAVRRDEMAPLRRLTPERQEGSQSRGHNIDPSTKDVVAGGRCPE